MKKGELTSRIEKDFSIREIGAELNVSYTTVRYWLKKYNLKTTARSGRKILDTEKEWRDRLDHNAYHRGYKKEQYQEYQKRLRDYKVSHGCMDCGYSAHHAGLEFDHRDGRNGERPISSLLGRGWNRVQEEIDKCDVVCGTCHNVRTWNRLKPNSENSDF